MLPVWRGRVVVGDLGFTAGPGGLSLNACGAVRSVVGEGSMGPSEQ